MALDNVTFTKALTSATSQEFQDRIGDVTKANILAINIYAKFCLIPLFSLSNNLT